MLLDLPKIELLQLRTGQAKLKIDKFNERIRLISFTAEAEELVERLELLTKDYKLGKVIYVGTRNEVEVLTDLGFMVEAEVEGLLKGEKGYFLSRFTIPERKISNDAELAEQILRQAEGYLQQEYNPTLQAGYEIRDVSLDDAPEIAALYDLVFETYPTPMNNPQYVAEVMQGNSIFKAAAYEKKIVSVASADLDPENLNAEITDCATSPKHRGSGLMEVLIRELEEELRQKNYLTAYTIARSISPGINIVFAKRGYHYSGRMVNNCHICGQFEDMNIWNKGLN